MTASGLARFLAPPADAQPEAAQAQPGAARAQPAEACDLCGAVLPGPDHDHLVDTGSRALLCACRACALLFTNPGAGSGRYQVVPSRVGYDRDFRLTAGEWDALQIPVGLAFFFLNSDLGRWVAFYPSPAGATESVLSLDSWAAVLARNPAMAGAAPDVEALMIRRRTGGFECYLVPIDACYRLVGLVRMYWKGFDGGSEVHAAIEEFFTEMATRARPIEQQ